MFIIATELQVDDDPAAPGYEAGDFGVYTLLNTHILTFEQALRELKDWKPEVYERIKDAKPELIWQPPNHS